MWADDYLPPPPPPTPRLIEAARALLACAVLAFIAFLFLQASAP